MRAERAIRPRWLWTACAATLAFAYWRLFVAITSPGGGTRDHDGLILLQTLLAFAAAFSVGKCALAFTDGLPPRARRARAAAAAVCALASLALFAVPGLDATTCCES